MLLFLLSPALAPPLLHDLLIVKLLTPAWLVGDLVHKIKHCPFPECDSCNGEVVGNCMRKTLACAVVKREAEARSLQPLLRWHSEHRTDA